jgi:hypothetical protein
MKNFHRKIQILIFLKDIIISGEVRPVCIRRPVRTPALRARPVGLLVDE